MKQLKTFRTIGAALMGVIMGVGITIGKYIDNLGVDVLKAKISFHKISVSQANRIKDYVQKYTS